MLKKLLASAACVFLVSVFAGYAATYTPEPSNRLRINLGDTPWKFIKSDPINAQSAAVSDATWKDVGVPYTPNDDDTFVNGESGGGPMFGGNCWYRKHFTLDNAYAGRKIFIEVEGAHMGCQLYINGTLMKGNSAITANANATHVIGFIGFVVDVTSNVTFGGADNLLAIRTGFSQGFYADPGFSEVFRFGQADVGLFRPVWLHITDPVHVPLNLYSVLNQWGTCVATTAASDASATVRIQTNVQNQSAAAQNVTLTTKIVDATNTVVSSIDNTQSIAAGQVYMFDQTATIANPHLWYPNNSTYGTPYMHTVYHIVKVGGTTVDVFQTPFGIRTITWDANFPYINGHKHCLYGASARYDYPALGTALSPEVEYRDAQILAKIGGSLWRPGHSSCSPGFVQACNDEGIMLMQPSGEGEGAFSTGANPTADRVTLKEEIQRDVCVRDRNNPSILAWEVSNGDIDPNLANAFRTVCKTWDPITPRAISVRGGPQFQAGDLIACTVTGCEMGLKNGHPLCPAWGAEAWGHQAARFAYDYELLFAEEFVQNWRKNIQQNCFGLCQWYLAETPGEAGDFEGGPTGPGVRSFGSSMMDFNRIPKLLYKIYNVCWVPYATKPVVFLAYHWNRSGTVRVNAFSNCPQVKLLLNGTDLGNKTPNPWTGTGDETTNQTTTQMPFQCWWDNVTWATGTLTAEGLDATGNVVCSDKKVTAGAPDHIVLTVDSAVVKPDGEVFQIRNNGSDAAFILAKVVDAAGNWCPTESTIVTFHTSGPCEYRGGSDQRVTTTQGYGYHSPLDSQLCIEGGMCKIAVRSRWTAGTATVTASAPGLGTGTTTFPISNVSTPVIRLAPATYSSSTSAFRMEVAGKTVRYFLSRPGIVAFDIITASGRVMKHIPALQCSNGWHQLALSGATVLGDTKGNGVYFVRCSLDGANKGEKRIAMVR
jgi:fructose-specific component phosphotransferase system IIB-like protein